MPNKRPPKRPRGPKETARLNAQTSKPGPESAKGTPQTSKAKEGLVVGEVGEQLGCFCVLVAKLVSKANLVSKGCGAGVA